MGAEEARLGAIGVGNRDKEGAVCSEKRLDIEQGLAGVEEVFEAVPEGDAVEGGELPGVAYGGDDEFGVAEAVEIEFCAVDVPAAGSGREEEATVSAADIEDFSRRVGISGLGDDSHASPGAPAGGEGVAIAVIAISVIRAEVSGHGLGKAVAS